MRLFAPKTAKENYTKDMLPHNRRQVFSDIVKLNYRSLLLCGVVLLAFLLPLHISAFLEYAYRLSVTGNIAENMSKEEISGLLISVVSFSNTKSLIDIPLWSLFFVGLSGVARIIRQYAWEENVFFRYDFAQGIKNNCKQYALFGLIVGLVIALCKYVYNLSTLASAQGEIYSYLGLIPTVLFTLLFFLPFCYALVCVSVYNNSIAQNVKIGLMLYGKHLWKSLLALLCGMALLIPTLIPNIYCMLIGRLVVSIALPFLMLAWWLFAFNSLDVYVNAKHFPALVGRGIFPSSHTDAKLD